MDDDAIAREGWSNRVTTRNWEIPIDSIWQHLLDYDMQQWSSQFCQKFIRGRDGINATKDRRKNRRNYLSWLIESAKGASARAARI